MIALVLGLALGAAPAFGEACLDDCVRRLHPCHQRAPHAPPCTEPPLPLRCDPSSTSAWCQAAREIRRCDDACDANARQQFKAARDAEQNQELETRRALTVQLEEARCEVDPVCRAERIRNEEEQRARAEADYQRQQEEARVREEEYRAEQQRQQEEAEAREAAREQREADERREEREYAEHQRAETDRYVQDSWNRTQESMRQSNDAWRRQMEQTNNSVLEAQRREAQRREDTQHRADEARERQRQHADEQRRADEARQRDRERIAQQQEELRQRQVAQREQAQHQREEQQQRDEQKRQEQERARQQAEEQKRLNACKPANQCLHVGKVLPGAGYCSTTSGHPRKDYLPVFKNGCNTGIDCRICGRGAADTHCVEWSFPAGDSLGGWASEFTWCDIDRVAWQCAAQIENHSAAHCVRDFQ